MNVAIPRTKTGMKNKANQQQHHQIKMAVSFQVSPLHSLYTPATVKTLTHEQEAAAVIPTTVQYSTYHSSSPKVHVSPRLQVSPFRLHFLDVQS